MVSPPPTCLLSALVWQPSDIFWSRNGSYIVPEDSNCSRRSFTLAGWSEKQKAYYYVPEAPVCSLVYQREDPSRYYREEHHPRFFLHDSGTFAFSKYRFSPADTARTGRPSNGPPFPFLKVDKGVTPDNFFHDDIQLNLPDLPGQPLWSSDGSHLSFSEAHEYGLDSDGSDISLESHRHARWARDMKWGQDSGLAIGSLRRTIWQKDLWGIEFNLEPVLGRLEFKEHPVDCIIKSYMVKATVLRVLVTQGKLESDANAQKDGTTIENAGDLGPGCRIEGSNCGDGGDLAARLSDTHIY